MKPEASKFCAGRTIDGWNVESIHRTAKIATTGTPGAFAGIPAEREVDGFGFWAMFVAVVFAFGVAGIEAAIENKKGGV